MAPLIGLYSPAPACGKSTLANGMAVFGWRTVKFAAPLKAMLTALLREVGESEAVIQQAIEGSLKNTPLFALAGATPRHAMQTLGTQWGRDQISDDLWVRLFVLRVERLRASGVPVICDDMRFPNEAETIRSMGGKIVRIERPGFADTSGHASEGALEGIEFDLVVNNDARCATSFIVEWAARVSEFGYQKEAA